MLQFKNIFTVVDAVTNINFANLVNYRKCVMEREGFRTDRINWDLYIKVLEVKHRELKNS